MSIFDLITLFGGLAMFLYGMRLMGDGLKSSSSGALKKAMEKVTGTPFKAFLLGLAMTAVIQSSTATIVITSGLVGAGIITLHQSLGVVIGANVGTTVTGQIIRLLDLDSSGVSFLQMFKPSTLAPVALIIGIVIIMSWKSGDADKIGQIVIGFGILFSGLLNMTDAVSVLSESGAIDNLLNNLGTNPVIGYIIGAGVAFVLQSSSATIGILQAFSTSGDLTFRAIYSVLVGIYLGDCVTTAIVCNIGARPEAKRVGVFNILFNLSKTVLILSVVTIIHKLGFLNGIWDVTIRSGGIANTNTVFNLACALVLLPFVNVYEKLSQRLVKDEPVPEGEYTELFASLNPVFISTPALAFNRCYDMLLVMYELARKNADRVFELLLNYDPKLAETIAKDENYIDRMADSLSNYLVKISGSVTSRYHVETMNYYYTVVAEFESLGDCSEDISDVAEEMHERRLTFSAKAVSELMVLEGLLDSIMDNTERAFRYQDQEAARHIEPLEEVVDDMVNALKLNHMERLRNGECNVLSGAALLNVLSEAERISDICSNVGAATVARRRPEIEHQLHDYVSKLHSGGDEAFNRDYNEAHELYFKRLKDAARASAPAAQTSAPAVSATHAAKAIVPAAAAAAKASAAAQATAAPAAQNRT